MSRNKGVEIDVSRARYPTSNDAIKNSELIPVHESTKPPFVWVDGILTKEEALEYLPYQKISKIPGMDHMCYKSSFFTALNEMSRYYPRVFNIYPKTYNIPHDFLDFQREHMQLCGRMIHNPTWVVKPRNSCCGSGIVIVQSVHEVSQITRQSVVQQYVKPFLINGKKFDFRLYVLIASIEPLRIFLYKEGIARFCSENFVMPNKSNKDDSFMHLTNTAINVKNGSASPADFTRKATEILDQIDNIYHNRDVLWEKICHCARGVVCAILPKLISMLPNSRHSSLIPSYLQAARKQANAKNDDTSEEHGKEDNLVDEHTISESDLYYSDYEESSQLPKLNCHIHKRMSDSSSPSKISRYIRLRDYVYQKCSTSILHSTVDFNIRGRSVGQAPTNQPLNFTERKYSTGCTLDTCGTLPDEIDVIKDNKAFTNNEKPKEVKVEEKKSQGRGLPPLKPKQKYFHIIGIDVILDSDLEPKILEINDRPSLSATVDFEYELKEGLIRHAFQHVSPTAESFGNDPDYPSDWYQIYPLPEDHNDYNIWNEIAKKVTNPKYNGEIDAQPVVSIRQQPVGLGSTQYFKKKKRRKRNKNKKKTKSAKENFDE